MVEIKDVFEDIDDSVYVMLEEDGRYCYYYAPVEVEDVDEYIKNNIPTISTIPHIEDANTATRIMWHELMSADDSMMFVEDDDLDWFLNKTKLTIEEFIQQVDEDIEKYNLQDVIEKNVDDCLYVCYGMFMQKFTAKVSTVKNKVYIILREEACTTYDDNMVIGVYSSFDNARKAFDDLVRELSGDDEYIGQSVYYDNEGNYLHLEESEVLD